LTKEPPGARLSRCSRALAHRPIEPRASLAQLASGDQPVFAQASANHPQRGVGLARLQEISEHRAQVVLLCSDATDRRGDSRRQAGSRLVRETGKVRGMRLADHLLFLWMNMELLVRELADGLQHGEARVPTGRVDLADQALLDERGETAEDVGG